MADKKVATSHARDALSDTSCIVELLRGLNHTLWFTAPSVQKREVVVIPKRRRDLLYLCVLEGIENHSEIKRRRRGID
jgi:hypothetical protein